MGSRIWSRREALLGLCATSLGAALRPTAARAGPRAPAPPRARLEAVQDTYFGEAVVDPYRWMEDPADRDWRPFLEGQAAHARSVLDAIPGRSGLLRRVAQLSGDTDVVRRVQAAGGRLFYERRPRGADSFMLFVRSGMGGEEQLLIDPTTLFREGRHVSVDWWAPSHGGEHLVFGLSAAGSEDSVAHVLEVDTALVLADRIDRTQRASPSWLPDGTGFFYNRLAEGATRGSTGYSLDSVAWLHRLGTDPARDLRVLSRGQFPEVAAEPTDFPIVLADPTSQLLLARLVGGARRENPVYAARLAEVLAGRPRWQKVCDVADEVVGVAVREDQLYLLTTRGAQNGMVLRTSAAAPALADAEVVVPEGPAVIEGIVAARDGLYLQDVDGGYGSLRVLETDEPARPVALPFEGTIEALAATPRQAGVWFVGTSWLLPRAVFRYDPVVGQVVKTGLTRPPDIDLSRFEAIRTHATARDGTRVPLSILAPRGLPRRGRAPALVDAHGAYQFVNAPDFDPRRIAFLEKGGVFAVAHVRGGGEYGKRWWKAGQKLQKPASWRDLIDCCEALVKLGFTGPGRLAIHGASAGGIAVGRALTERPDLFAAAISRVGVSNALRAEFSQSGPSSVAELGTVREADGFRGLLAMDAYHSVKDGLAYPAVLLTTGMTDPRVEPWQAAKLAARLQRASSSGRPVLLRVTFDAGHGLGSTRTQLDQEAADVYAFVLWRAAQPAPPRPGR